MIGIHIGRRALASACLALATSGSSGLAAASSCGTRSPRLDALGEGYLALGDAASETLSTSASLPIGSEPARPAARRVDLLERLHSARLGSGSGERVRCRGGDGRQREVVWLFDLEGLERVDALDGRTLLTAFESRHTVITEAVDDRLVGGTLVAETIDVPPPALWQASDGATTLRANRRFRRVGAASVSCALATARVPGIGRPISDDGGGARRCSHVTEIDTTIRAVGRSIELEQVLYVDGLWSERVRWRIDA